MTLWLSAKTAYANSAEEYILKAHLNGIVSGDPESAAALATPNYRAKLIDRDDWDYLVGGFFEIKGSEVMGTSTRALLVRKTHTGGQQIEVIYLVGRIGGGNTLVQGKIDRGTFCLDRKQSKLCLAL